MVLDTTPRLNELLTPGPINTGGEPDSANRSPDALQKATLILVGAGTAQFDWFLTQPREFTFVEPLGGTLDLKSGNMPKEAEVYTVLRPYVAEGGEAGRIARIRKRYVDQTETFDEWATMLYGFIQEPFQTVYSEEWSESQPLPSELQEALSDLELVIDEAQENDWELPSVSAQSNAERVLRALYDNSPRRFEAYSMPNGDISVVAKGLRSHWVLLSIEPDGGALCVVCMDGEESHQHYDDTASLPDDFMREAISRIGNRQ